MDDILYRYIQDILGVDIERSDVSDLSEQLNAVILEEVLAMIGEDDDMTMYINPESDEDLLITIGENANNRLRAELRTAAKAKWGVK